MMPGTSASTAHVPSGWTSVSTSPSPANNRPWGENAIPSVPPKPSASRWTSPGTESGHAPGNGSGSGSFGAQPPARAAAHTSKDGKKVGVRTPDF